MIRTNSGRANSQSARGRYYTRYLAHYAKKNYMLLALGALFICGVAAGTMLMRAAGGDTVELISRIVNGYLEKRRDQTLLQNIVSTASSSLIFVATLFVCGFCAISQPVILLAPFLRGLGFGFSAASIYAEYGTRAMPFVALFVVPDMLISSLAILLCGRESLRLSGNFWNVLWKTGEGEGYPLRIYVGRYVAAGILCIFSAFLAAVLYFAFANYVVLG